MTFCLSLRPSTCREPTPAGAGFPNPLLKYPRGRFVMGSPSHLPKSQWLFLVPIKGGRWHIIPELAVYTTYILPSRGLYNPYHLLPEPQKSIEKVQIAGHEPLRISHMDAEPKIGGFYPPKWMVKIMEKPYEQIDDLGVP